MPSTESVIPELLSQGSGSLGRRWVLANGFHKALGQVLPYFLRLCPKMTKGEEVDGREGKVLG